MKACKYPRIKICCISSIEEAQLAIDCGASALGLVGQMPSGPGVITDALINSIAQYTPPAISTFLLSSETNADAIINHYKKVNTTTIQLVDALTDKGYRKIKSQLPGVKLVQVIHVVDENAVEQATDIAQYVDAILLDSGNPQLKVKELGGTGRTHNWQLSKQIRQKIDIPLFLAGGINQHNVVAAIKQVQPFAIDLCSSVRTDNKLDKEKLQAFFQVLNNTPNL
ncbi:MAG TPA: phosphoribosylanthranilate isomerase [Oceanospirillales bacterium]|nr:phosphoribosylanthranilate isomerase [Oceanospirillales bacterium]